MADLFTTVAIIAGICAVVGFMFLILDGTAKSSDIDGASRGGDVAVAAFAALGAGGCILAGLHAHSLHVRQARAAGRKVVALAAAAENQLHERYGGYSATLLDLEHVSPRFTAAVKGYSGKLELTRSSATHIIYIDARAKGAVQAQDAYSTAG